MAEETAPDQTTLEQTQSGSASEEGRQDSQDLAEQILAEIRAADARDDKRVRDWVNDPKNLPFEAEPGRGIEYYTKLVEETRAAEAARTAQRANEVGEFLQRERTRITEVQSVRSEIDPQDVPVFEAYLSGRRDSYNDFREQALTAHPTLATDLPPAIAIDEISVQQEVVRQEERQDQSLSLAR